MTNKTTSNFLQVRSRKGFFRPAFLFCAGLFLALCQAANGQADETSRSWNQPVKPFRIIGDIYYVGASDITSFLIASPEGHILLDGGFAETAPQIRQNILALGFRLEDVKYLLNSQAHYDHAGGLAELKKLTGAKMLASRADAVLLEDGGKSDFHFRDPLFHFTPVKVDRFVNDGDTVKLRGVTLTARLTPGHTKGCTTWTTRAVEKGQTYDVVFVCSASVPGYNLKDTSGYPNIVADYRETFRRLKKLPADVFLGSHGIFFGLQKKIEMLAAGPRENPFVDPAGYQDYLKRAESAFEALLKKE